MIPDDNPDPLRGVDDDVRSETHRLDAYGPDAWITIRDPRFVHGDELAFVERREQAEKAEAAIFEAQRDGRQVDVEQYRADRLTRDLLEWFVLDWHIPGIDYVPHVVWRWLEHGPLAVVLRPLALATSRESDEH